MVLVFVQDRLTDLDFMRSVDADLDRLFRLNIGMQKVFTQWNELEEHQALPPMFIPAFPALIEGIRGLVGEYSDDDLRETLKHHVRTSEALAVVFFCKAAQALSDPLPPDARIDPYAVSLDPPRWEGDGGLTLAEAGAIAKGAGALWPALERQ